jgi:hypothetical protein
MDRMRTHLHNVSMDTGPSETLVTTRALILIELVGTMKEVILPVRCKPCEKLKHRESPCITYLCLATDTINRIVGEDRIHDLCRAAEVEPCGQDRYDIDFACAQYLSPAQLVIKREYCIESHKPYHTARHEMSIVNITLQRLMMQ